MPSLGRGARSHDIDVDCVGLAKSSMRFVLKRFFVAMASLINRILQGRKGSYQIVEALKSPSVWKAKVLNPPKESAQRL